MRLLLLPSVLLFCVTTLFSQGSSVDTLSNQDVIQMVAAGIPTGVIITKIKNTPTKFTTDIASLKALTDAQVPEVLISAMIERSAQEQTNSDPLVPKPGETPVPNGPRVASPHFTPYLQLSKSEQKARLKSPVQIDIAAPSDTVQSLLVRAFQSQKYRVEENSPRSLYFVKDDRSFGATLMAGMAGGDNVQWQARVTISELGGISHVSVNITLSMENTFGKRYTESADNKSKTRGPLEDLLDAVKNEAERRQ